MQISEITRNYLKDIPRKNLHLAIMGKDPYPTDATGIPFCKPTWEQQLSQNCSGRFVLLSLGFNPGVLQQKYDTPIHLFEELREYGIVFLNVSYKYIGKAIRKKHHLVYLQNSYQHNRLALEAARLVLFCGEAEKILRWGIMPINNNRYRCVIHPDVRNKNNPNRSDSWQNCWGDDALYNELLLSVPSRER